MKRPLSHQPLIQISAALLVGLQLIGHAGASPVQASAEPISPVRQVLKQFNFSTNFTPPGDGAPKDTSTAGSRDEGWCRGTPIRSLMPAHNYGLTFAAQPKIYLEMPQVQATQALFVLETETGDHRQEMTLSIPATRVRGVAVLVPEPMMLEVGKNYRWSLAVMCQDYLAPSDPVFTGWVQRVQASTATRKVLNRLSATEQARWFSQQGYWYDLVSTVLQHSLIED